MTAHKRSLLNGPLKWGMICLSLIGLPESAAAQDAPFGCKVLLCAASSNPSWSGIPYCVPVMQELFKQLAKGGSWPTCPGSSTSSLRHEPYQACPAGQPVTRLDQGGGVTSYRDDPSYGSFCGVRSPARGPASQRCEAGAVYDEGTAQCLALTTRPENEKPYAIDLDLGGGKTTTFNFALTE